MMRVACEDGAGRKKGLGRRDNECEDPRAGRSYGHGVQSFLTEGRAGGR